MALRKLIKIGLLSFEPNILLKANSILGLMNLIVGFLSFLKIERVNLSSNDNQNILKFAGGCGYSYILLYCDRPIENNSQA